MRSVLTPFAKQLRRKSTDAERLLWRHLRAGRFEGYKFRRQQPLGRFVVDFVCFEARLVLELDGGQHAEQAAADEIRDRWLREQGFNVLRFWNNELFENMEGVLQRIGAVLSPSPLPLCKASPIKGEGVNEETLP